MTNKDVLRMLLHFYSLYCSYLYFVVDLHFERQHFTLQLHLIYFYNKL